MRSKKPIGSISTEGDWPPDLTYQIELILEELCINVISHGEADGTKPIKVVIVSRNDEITIEMSDNGKAFDPTKDAKTPSKVTFDRRQQHRGMGSASGAYVFGRNALRAGRRDELFDPSQTEDGLKIPLPELAASKSAAIRVAVASISLFAILACLDAREDVATPFVSTVETANEFELLNPKSAVASDAANDRNGITDDRILFGQSAAFSGPASELGLGMARWYIGRVQRGERGGRSSWSPARSRFSRRRIRTRSRNRQYRGSDRRGQGFRTSRSGRDSNFEVPQFPLPRLAGRRYVAPFTGAEFLRSPDYQHILNVRASYYQETAGHGQAPDGGSGHHSHRGYVPRRFVRPSWVSGGQISSGTRRMEPVAIGIYPRHTKAIKTALLRLEAGRTGSGDHDRCLRTRRPPDILGAGTLSSIPNS